MVPNKKADGESIFSLYMLRCNNCGELVESELKRQRGIVGVELNDAAGTAKVSFDSNLTTTDTIRNYIRELCQAAQSNAAARKRHSPAKRSR